MGTGRNLPRFDAWRPGQRQTGALIGSRVNIQVRAEPGSPGAHDGESKMLAPVGMHRVPQVKTDAVILHRHGDLFTLLEQPHLDVLSLAVGFGI